MEASRTGRLIPVAPTHFANFGDIPERLMLMQSDVAASVGARVASRLPAHAAISKS